MIAGGEPVVAPDLGSVVTDPRSLRAAFGAFATGVTVATVGGRVPHGMTANAFTPVSLSPPLVLLCVRRDARMHDSLAATGTFALSVLAADQERIARHFADRCRPRGRAQFDPVGWVAGGHTGAPLIRGAVAWFECRLWRTYDGGDHSIFVGRLLSAVRQRDPPALLYVDGTFRQLDGAGQVGADGARWPATGAGR